MRIVKWTPQERVDIPDITAMGFLVLGEFRRTVRGALGVDGNSIINGFTVEPAGVPDTTITVKLDNGGALSFAYGAEIVGARTDYGQLIGGDNSDGNTEGNAQQSIDFTGQPVATYTVKIRFLYSDGANDNRAFWNETGNTEFISAIDTRHLPQYEISITGSGNVMVSRTTGSLIAQSVSPVVVSFRPANAMMSPANASVISSRSIACIIIIRPTRSLRPLVEFTMASPLASVPE